MHRTIRHSSNFISLLLFTFVLGACGKPGAPGNGRGGLAVSGTPGSSNCQPEQQRQFAELRASQTEWYQKHGFPIPSESDQSQLFLGTSGRTEILVHGFISSPAAMQQIAQGFIDRGDTVIMPLLTGFGFNAQAANAASVGDWRSAVKASFQIAQLCDAPVSIVAHSLGAALVSEYLLLHGTKGVAHLALLSPYFRASEPAVSSAIRLLRHLTDVLSIAQVKAWTGHDPYSWLPISRPAPGQPDWAVPLSALELALGLQAEFALSSVTPVTLQPQFHSEVLPTLLVVSEADGVIDPKYAPVFAKAAFTSVEELIYTASEKIGHSLETPSGNPEFVGLQSRLESFFN